MSRPKKGQAKPARVSVEEDFNLLQQLLAQKAPKADVPAEAAQGPQDPPEPSPALNPEAQTNLPTEPPGFDEPPPSSLPQLLEDPFVSIHSVAQVYSTVEAQAREHNKENIEQVTPRRKTFIDHQKGAKRVSPDDEGHQEVSGRQHVRNSPSDRKRVRTRHVVDDEEENFEARAPGVADQRRRELRGRTEHTKALHRPARRSSRNKIPQPSKSTGPTDGDEDVDADHDIDDERTASEYQSDSNTAQSYAQQSPLSIQRHQGLPGTRYQRTPQPPAPEPVSTAQYLDLAREKARRNVVLVKPSRVQSRSPYSSAEEQRLIDLIEEHGTSYTLIKQLDNVHEDGPLLQERSQVQLKDKAQDMKFQFLK